MTRRLDAVVGVDFFVERQRSQPDVSHLVIHQSRV